MFSGPASDLQAQVMPLLHVLASPPQGSDAERLRRMAWGDDRSPSCPSLWSLRTSVMTGSVGVGPNKETLMASCPSWEGLGAGVRSLVCVGSENSWPGWAAVSGQGPSEGQPS